MATGKPPWSQQYQEVAALFHVGTTKSHPPIPEHLSSEAKDFLLKCLHEEPNLRPTTSDLLQQPSVVEEYQDTHPLSRSSTTESSSSMYQTPKAHRINNLGPSLRPLTSSGGLRNVDYGDGNSLTISQVKHLGARHMWSSDSGDMCRFNDDDEDFPVAGSSFNPVSEPFDDWPCKFGVIPERRMDLENSGEPIRDASESAGKCENDFSFPCDMLREDVYEDTEIKITAFLEEKALDLKKLMTPLHEEFLNMSNPLSISSGVGKKWKDNITSSSKLPPKIKQSPSKVVSGASTPHADTVNNNTSTGNCSRRVSIVEVEGSRILSEITSSLNEKELPDAQQKPNNSPRDDASGRCWRESFFISKGQQGTEQKERSSEVHLANKMTTEMFSTCLFIEIMKRLFRSMFQRPSGSSMHEGEEEVAEALTQEYKCSAC